MRRRGRVSGLALAAAAVAMLAGGGAAAAKPAPAATTPAVLAPTPYMGWDVYLAGFGGSGETTILQQADRLKTTGLEALGYRIIWFDSGWWQGQRDASGNIVVNPTQWPHGIAWLASVLHANGFELGVYTDAGATGCGVPGGLYGHDQQDINTFASWGVDAIKVDWCGGAAMGLNPATRYAQVHQAILDNSSHRPMLLAVCNFLQPGQGPTNPSFSVSAFVSYSFGPSDGQSWRTDTDVGSPANVPFGSVLRNLDADATEPFVAGPGHWNDPDYLAPDQGLTAAQFQTQESMWAMLAAPFMFSDNMLTISSTSLAALENKNVIAVDQDPAGIQAFVVPGSVAGNGEAWARPLSDGSYAVAFLNRGSPAQTIATTAAAVGLPPAKSYTVTDLWTNATSTTTGALSATVAPFATVLWKVKPAAAAAKASGRRVRRRAGA
jgi:alpha-galactosidase